MTISWGESPEVERAVPSQGISQPADGFVDTAEEQASRERRTTSEVADDVRRLLYGGEVAEEIVRAHEHADIAEFAVHALELFAQYTVFSRFDFPMPVVKVTRDIGRDVEYSVPVQVLSSSELEQATYENLASVSVEQKLSQVHDDFGQDVVELVPPGSAVDSFVEVASDFLQRRLRSMTNVFRVRSEPVSTTPPRIPLQVNCETPGLVVVYSPEYAFRHAAPKVFGGLTSPVSASVVPSTYFFGTTSLTHPTKPPVWDLVVYEAPGPDVWLAARD